MKYRIIAFTTIIALLIVAFAGCGPKTTSAELGISPEAGTRYKLGDAIQVKVSIPLDIKADSVQYLIDSIRITSRKDTMAATIKTDSLKCGSRLLTARVFAGGKPQEVSTNIIMLAAKAPDVYGYIVEKVFPHDTGSYTEGLQYVDGYLYESAGNYGESNLRKVDLNTGKVLQSVKLDAKYFGEGIAVVGDKIVELTYREGDAFVYDKNTLKQLSTFKYTWGKEGWGMCYDGKTIYNNDSTNRIFMLNKDTYQPFNYIDVYDNTHDIQEVNEMEYVDGKIYANVYQTDTIIQIDPKNGAVLETIDLSNLYPKASRIPNADVLNGIAWDEKGKRLFITGKKWPHLYQVKFYKK
jgi:glutamine cyclotransferase